MNINQALNHRNILGAGAMKRKQLSNPNDKFKVVMKEFERGTLHSGGGNIVTSYKQALAIAYSEKKRHNQ